MIDKDELEEAIGYYDGMGGPLAQCIVDAAKEYLKILKAVAGDKPIKDMRSDK